jgi:hypothetical protein
MNYIDIYGLGLGIGVGSSELGAVGCVTLTLTHPIIVNGALLDLHAVISSSALHHLGINPQAT